MANHTHVRVKKTLYKQKLIKLLYEGADGDVKLLASLAGCSAATAYKNVTRWNRMTAGEKETAYLLAVKELGAEPAIRRRPEALQIPEHDIHSMDGIHTPYNFIKRPRRRMWVSHY